MPFPDFLKVKVSQWQITVADRVTVVTVADRVTVAEGKRKRPKEAEGRCGLFCTGSSQ